MNKKPDNSLLPVTAGDINKLKSMVDDLYNNVGKTLVHAEVNDDDIESTVSNICPTSTAVLLIVGPKSSFRAKVLLWSRRSRVFPTTMFGRMNTRNSDSAVDYGRN